MWLGVQKFFWLVWYSRLYARHIFFTNIFYVVADKWVLIWSRCWTKMCTMMKQTQDTVFFLVPHIVWWVFWRFWREFFKCFSVNFKRLSVLQAFLLTLHLFRLFSNTFLSFMLYLPSLFHFTRCRSQFLLRQRWLLFWVQRFSH